MRLFRKGRVQGQLFEKLILLHPARFEGVCLGKLEQR